MSWVCAAGLLVSAVGPPRLAQAQSPAPPSPPPVASPSPSDNVAKLLELTDPSDPTYPTLLFRLGTSALDEAFDLRQQRSGDEGSDRSLRDAELERRAMVLDARALDAFERLVNDRRFRSYSRRDEVAYELALLYQRLDRRDDMRRAIVTLVRDHPASKSIPAAYLLLADDMFDRGQYDNAERVYDKVTQFSNAREAGYAHYKIAWCRLNPKPDRDADPTGALTHFVRAIERADQSPAGFALRSSARRDLVVAYAQVGRPGKAAAFFGRVGRGPGPSEDQVSVMLELLEQRYRELGRQGDADMVRRGERRQ